MYPRTQRKYYSQECLTPLRDRKMTAKAGEIRIGIGGWTFEPWRGVFYPKGLPHAKELAYASARLTSIEINGTFYRSQPLQNGRARCRPDSYSHSKARASQPTAGC